MMTFSKNRKERERSIYLPRNTSENEEHSVIEILADILRLQSANPVDFWWWNGTNGRISQRKWDADPLRFFNRLVINFGGIIN